MRDYDSWKFSGDKEYMVSCRIHGGLHLENDPCPECVNRYEKAQYIKSKRRKVRDLKIAMYKSRESSGWFDAICRLEAL